MRVIEISAFNNYSVGKIMNDIAINLIQLGHECKVIYARGNSSDNFFAGKKSSIFFNALLARIFDNDGFCLKSITKRIIKEIDKFNPHIIHIHCLHGYYFNCSLFFEYLKKHETIKVVWTMHDNWAVSGHCAYASFRHCDLWKTNCKNCPAKKDYPKTFFDHSKRNFTRKKNTFSMLDSKQLYIVSPSAWLDKIIELSFLKKYNHSVILNGIDVSKFKDLKRTRKKVLLAVASVWDERKNLNRVLEVSNNLKEWNIVVIGKIHNKSFKPNVSFIDRTNNLDELIEMYNNASILINPTLADNFPTVNIEAQLCGLKVLTYNTGGALETDLGKLFIIDENTFINDEYLDNILKLEVKTLDKNLSREYMSNRYIDLFKSIIEKTN